MSGFSETISFHHVDSLANSLFVLLSMSFNVFRRVTSIFLISIINIISLRQFHQKPSSLYLLRSFSSYGLNPLPKKCFIIFMITWLT